MFVLPLDFRHRQQAIDQVHSAALSCVTCGGFILDNVLALEPAGTVHRRKPAAHVTQETKRSSDDCGAQFAPLVWSTTEIFEHLADQTAMLPFLVFDRFDLRSFFGVVERMPVTAISVTGRQLARVRELQDVDQLIFGS